jgi:CRP-like cAMP-binding protein
MAATYPEFLAGLAPVDAAALVALGSIIRLSRGDVLFDLGQQADSLYVIEQGQIALTLPLQIRFTLKATAPLDSRVVAFPRVALLEHFARHPDVGYVVMRNVASMTGQRLQVFQAMWLREMQRTVTLSGV